MGLLWMKDGDINLKLIHKLISSIFRFIYSSILNTPTLKDNDYPNQMFHLWQGKGLSTYKILPYTGHRSQMGRVPEAGQSRSVHSHWRLGRKGANGGWVRQLLWTPMTSHYTRAALDKLGLKRYCCRRMLLTHVDLIEKLLNYTSKDLKISTNPITNSSL